jgi:toxin secretion/phage lysis holin
MILIVVDYISGVIASATEGKLSSKVGMIGIAKKVFIFLLVTVAHKIDVALGNGHIFRDAVIYFYIANELLSITENGGRMGMPMPSVFSKMIAVIQSKGGEQDASKDSE